MSICSIFLIALALAMDAFAVSISSGITISRMHLRLRHALLIASFFGAFQGIMPFIGWHVGHGIKPFIAGWDHWIAFLLLFAVGAKMIFDACTGSQNDKRSDPLNIYVLFVLSIATSIDALAVGLTLSLVNLSIIFPVLVIGAITFVMSFIGTYLGSIFGHLFERKVEIVGGLMLIGIGVKILVQHIFG